MEIKVDTLDKDGPTKNKIEQTKNGAVHYAPERPLFSQLEYVPHSNLIICHLQLVSENFSNP